MTTRNNRSIYGKAGGEFREGETWRSPKGTQYVVLYVGTAGSNPRPCATLIKVGGGRRMRKWADNVARWAKVQADG